jgi:hypothetical protein
MEVGASTSRTLVLTVDPEVFSSPYFCAELLSEGDINAGDNRQCMNFDESDFIFEPYPNPTTGLLNLDWVAEKAGSALVTIYNGQGKVAYSWETPSAAGLNQSVHDLSFLASGIYFVTVQTSTVVQTRRFVRI